jgi:flagellar assembly protein FliH
MSAAPARFTFDLDLGHRDERGRMVTENRLAEMLRDARNEGFAAGFAEGQQGTESQSMLRLAQAAEAFADRAAADIARVEAERQEMLAEAAGLATEIGRKLALHLIAREPAAELQALIAECLATLEGVPHLVVRCHPGVADAVRETSEARMALTGFSGRLAVIADPEVGFSDGRIEWADGGLKRDLEAISAEIDRTISTFLAARGGTAKENDQ